MCNTDLTSRTLLPDLLYPQCDAMSSSSRKDMSNALAELGTMFVATIVDAKDFIDQLEATFCNELWPAIGAELVNTRRRVMDLAKEVDVTRKQLEERQELQLEMEDERTRLRIENGVLRTEKALLLKNLKEAQTEGLEQKGTDGEAERLIQENHNLHSKLQSLTEENLEGEKQRLSLAEEVEQLQEAAKVTAAKEILLEAENKKFAATRPHIEKLAVVKAKRQLSLKGQKKPPRGEGHPSSSMAERDVVPVSSDDPQNSKNWDLVQSVGRLQDMGQAVDCSASDLDKEPMQGRSSVGTLADKAIDGAAVVIPVDNPFENPLSGQPMLQADPAKDSEVPLHVKEALCHQSPKANCDVKSTLNRIRIPSTIDSDETTLGIVQEDPLSAGIAQEYPVISISSETQAGPCDEPLQLACEKLDIVTSHRAVEQKVEESKGVLQKRAPLVPIPPNLRIFRPASKTPVTNKPVGRPKEKPWRQTRLRAEPSDRDPHDSFLDTPREKILAQLAADAEASREEAGRAADSLALAKVGPAPVTNKVEGINGLEAREGGEKAAARRQDHPPPASNAGGGRQVKEGNTKATSSKAPPFKFNEPVRKKRDREDLPWTDCKQCKKFYDAVAAADADGAERSRCEHHDAASRHRFKYLPPPTPDGFWNIGFDDSIDPPDRVG